MAASAGVIAGRRTGRPSARSALGGLLVAAAAVMVFAAVLAAGGDHGSPYVVATRALPAGSVIGPGDLGTARMRLPAAAREAAFSSPAALVGRTLTVAAAGGELVEASMVAPAGAPALRPVSIAVDSDSLSGLAAGAEVDVLATSGGASGGAVAAGGPSPSAAAAELSVVVRGATLLEVDRGGSGLLAGPATATVVRLGVADLAEAEDLVRAAHSGTVELIQAEPSDGSGPGPGSAAGSGPGSSSGSVSGS